jgi:hypothetical protein
LPALVLDNDDATDGADLDDAVAADTAALLLMMILLPMIQTPLL